MFYFKIRCPKCKQEFKIKAIHLHLDYKHFGRYSYMKCPHCNKKAWMKPFDGEEGIKFIS